MAVSYDTAVDAYLDNADYEAAGSVAKAQAFVTACVQLAMLLPSSASSQGSSQSFDIGELRANKERAQAYIAANAAGARTRFLSVNTGGFR